MDDRCTTRGRRSHSVLGRRAMPGRGLDDAQWVRRRFRAWWV